MLEGAFHGAEIPFALGDVEELPTSGEVALSEVMGKLWANFVASGNPNRGPHELDPEMWWPEVSALCRDAIYAYDFLVLIRITVHAI